MSVHFECIGEASEVCKTDVLLGFLASKSTGIPAHEDLGSDAGEGRKSRRVTLPEKGSSKSQNGRAFMIGPRCLIKNKVWLFVRTISTKHFNFTLHGLFSTVLSFAAG